jgi:hypothetical protein
MKAAVVNVPLRKTLNIPTGTSKAGGVRTANALTRKRLNVDY